MFFRPKLKLDFAIVGAQKAGTTALYHFLSQHPKVLFGSTKELHYFDNDANFDSNNREINNKKLGKLFERLPRSKGVVLGDATPITMFYPNAIDRLVLHNPRAKIICVLRNPVDRAYSHWKMEVARKKEELSFEEAIFNEAKRIVDDNTFRTYSYFQRGLYSKQIQKLKNAFAEENCLFLRHEDLRNNHNGTLDSAFNFLGIDSLVIEQQIIHKSNDKHKMNLDTKNRLTELYLEEIQKTEKLLNWDLANWINS